MAQVLLLTVTDHNDSQYNRGAFLRLHQSARNDAFKVHCLTDDPCSADVILFSELLGAGFYLQSLRNHSLVREFRDKCFLFCSNDFVIPFLPGIYASIERRWSSERTRSGFYLAVSENGFVTFSPPRNDLEYLYSFVGSIDTAPVRRSLLKLSHPRSFFMDTAADYQRALHGKMSAPEERAYWLRYADVCKKSKFILCPRGLGASTVRLFDTMRMGRVPVILSDQWVESEGPCWKEFSLRIPENELARIPNLLEEREPEAARMGQLARRQWEEWFSERVLLSSHHRRVSRHQASPALARAMGTLSTLHSVFAAISFSPFVAHKVSSLER